LCHLSASVSSKTSALLETKCRLNVDFALKKVLQYWYLPEISIGQRLLLETLPPDFDCVCSFTVSLLLDRKALTATSSVALFFPH
ncbi:MAG: hypothetical protein SO073_06720, partial [Candidatus Onthomonas sp.]|nr:hypothetical protein [Candidatus Onthomonas sp.]